MFSLSEKLRHISELLLFYVWGFFGGVCIWERIKLAGRSSLKWISRQIKLVSVITQWGTNPCNVVIRIEYNPLLTKAIVYIAKVQKLSYMQREIQIFSLLWYFCLHSRCSYGTECIPDPSSLSMWPLFLCPVAGTMPLWWWSHSRNSLLQVSRS